ncbi:MAG TPA: hypothetical protein VGI71_23260 [Scandinavium sp.]
MAKLGVLVLLMLLGCWGTARGCWDCMLLVLLNLWVLMCVLRERCWVVGCWVPLTLLGCWVLLMLLRCVVTLEYCARLLAFWVLGTARSC